MMNTSEEQVLNALNSLFSTEYKNDNAHSDRKAANLWLQEYQKTPQAWTITASLIRNPTSSLQTRVFCAQTLRQKIEYDIHDLDTQALTDLRNSITELLLLYSSIKPIITQLCIAVADLAIQMTAWVNPVGYMIDAFKTNHLYILLEFLAVLPEELAYNTKISLEAEDFDSKSQSLLKNNSNSVLELLFLTLQQSGQDEECRIKILSCLCSWIKSGAITPIDILNSSLVQMAFEALLSEATFDIAVDLTCEIILVSSKKPINEQLIQAIYPFLNNMNDFLNQSIDNLEIVEGLCKIFVEASEGYCDLIIANLPAFQSILQGLLTCSACKDTDTIKFTVNTWYLLSESIIADEKSVARDQFVPLYQSLLEIIIKKMRYPHDFDSLSAEERDDFRDFRHDIGDVLKDCVRVLGEKVALQTPYNSLRLAFEANQSTPNTCFKWQEIEAPLFSLRTMCREVSNNESTYIPHIMAILPQLPAHPKIKYAAILVIGRYAQWTNQHPEMISYQLDFITQGFGGDVETGVAAAHTFRDLCKYCGTHLVKYIDKLQEFYSATLPSLSILDQKEMSEAVSYLIAAAPFNSLELAVGLFCMPVATRLHSIVARYGGDNDTPSILELNSTLDELGTLMQFIDVEVPTGSVHPSITLLVQMWPVFERIFSDHYQRLSTAEALSRFLRHVINATKVSFHPLLAQLMSQLVLVFQKTLLSCYVWTLSKIVQVFGDIEVYRGAVIQVIESVTQSVFQMVQTSGQSQEEDIGYLGINLVVEEFYYMLSMYVDNCPTIFLQSPLLQSTFQCAIFCLTTASHVSVIAVLRFISDILELSKPGKGEITNMAMNYIHPVLELSCPSLVRQMFRGIIYTFAKDRAVIAEVAEIIHCLSLTLGCTETVRILGDGVAEFPVAEMSNELKSLFMTKLQIIVHAGQVMKLGSLLCDFGAAYDRRNLINSRK